MRILWEMWVGTWGKNIEGAGLGSRGFVPGRRATFVSAKVAKTIDAPSGLIEEEGRELFEERPNSLRSNKVR